ncbi:hypothetical protein AHAS_Ahas01G0201200 [Arachis hypogaea]
MAMEVELEPMAASIGVTVPVLRFLLCFAATVPLSFLWRIVPGLLPKHLYSTGIGVSLSYIFFGLSSNMHFLVLIMVGYSFLLLLRPRCGILTFFLGFGYLIGWYATYVSKNVSASILLLYVLPYHVYYMSGDDTGEDSFIVHFFFSFLFLILLVYDFLTVIEGHFNYNDRLLKEEEGLREAQRKYRLTKLPFLVEYIGYCLCCMTHFAGSVFEMKDNLDWTEGKGIWSKEAKRPSPLPYGATIRALIQADFCMALYLYLVPYFPLSRSFYYHLWSWLVNSSPPKPRWDRAKNVDILGVEFAKSSVVIPTVWNIQVSTWLRRYVYERLVQSGKKPGFFQLLATQTISAIWHGVYPGYIIFFVQSALMIAGSRGNTLE